MGINVVWTITPVFLFQKEENIYYIIYLQGIEKTHSTTFIPSTKT